MGFHVFHPLREKKPIKKTPLLPYRQSRIPFTWFHVYNEVVHILVSRGCEHPGFHPSLRFTHILNRFTDFFPPFFMASVPPTLVCSVEVHEAL